MKPDVKIALIVCVVMTVLGIVLSMVGVRTPTEKVRDEVATLKTELAAAKTEIETLKSQLTSLTLDVRSAAQDLMLTRQAMPIHLESNAKTIAEAASQANLIRTNLTASQNEADRLVAGMKDKIATVNLDDFARKTDVAATNNSVAEVKKKVDGIVLDPSTWVLTKTYCKCHHK